MAKRWLLRHAHCHDQLLSVSRAAADGVDAVELTHFAPGGACHGQREALVEDRDCCFRLVWPEGEVTMSASAAFDVARCIMKRLEDEGSDLLYQVELP